jgi:hypothetical protein
MRTPSRPLPEAPSRWLRYSAAMRWADAAVAWLALFLVIGSALEWSGLAEPALFAGALVTFSAFLPALRVRWRPVSAAVGIAIARPLRPGDRAWYLRAGQAEAVIVTARHGARIVIAWPGTADEGLTVRASRVLLLPEDRA